ncbi:MAG: cation:dicarboxylase symporter family transporter [Polyangiaceae bacterium]
MSVLRSYGSSAVLIVSIVLGAGLGKFAPALAIAMRPVGELFLNLIFMVLVPLVFFTVSSSVAVVRTRARLSRLALSMVVVFLLTSFVAATAALLFMLVFESSTRSAYGSSLREDSGRSIVWWPACACGYCRGLLAAPIQEQHIAANRIFGRIWSCDYAAGKKGDGNVQIPLEWRERLSPTR